MNVYSTPEEYGLEPVGEIEWGDACYSFNLTVVWVDAADRFWFAEDAGCSCPTPFDELDLRDLDPATPLADFQARLLARNADTYAGDRSPAIAELIERMHKRGAR